MKVESRENSGSGFFQICDGDKVIILKKGGSYKEVDLYMRGKQLFAEIAKGEYVRLAANGSTSNPTIVWDEIVSNLNMEQAPMGISIKGKK